MRSCLFQFPVCSVLVTLNNAAQSSRPTKPYKPASRSIEKPTRHLRRKVLCHGIVQKATFMHDMASVQLLILENFTKVRGNQPSIHSSRQRSRQSAVLIPGLVSFGATGKAQMSVVSGCPSNGWCHAQLPVCLTQTPCSTFEATSGGRVYSVKRRNKQSLAKNHRTSDG
ncbi:hypothetical protein CI102_6545 [Trichoderma harzianum]|jgi:hypothetical protein|nr:hypothetical protein CI102_6545 [Trichoderma harzianum]